MSRAVHRCSRGEALCEAPPSPAPRRFSSSAEHGRSHLRVARALLLFPTDTRRPLPYCFTEQPGRLAPLAPGKHPTRCGRRPAAPASSAEAPAPGARLPEALGSGTP